MTSGGQNGTSGDNRLLGPWALVALVGVAVATINASSDMIEMERAGLDRAWWEPIVWEGTSAAIIVALAPLIGWAVRRWPPSLDSLLRFGLTHLALTIPFALIHIAVIFVTREAIYWALGQRYGFFDDGVAITMVYEWRKDVLTYAAIASVYWLYDFARARQTPAPQPNADRIEVRDGSSTIYLAPADVLTVEAAGNYVEFRTAARAHLVRGTLASWEVQLTARGFVRVHRSRLVNRARISAIKPTASGDVEITLDDGRVVAGSRRYRDALDTPAASL